MNRPQLKGAFAGCSWCYGRGCLQCDIEREKAIEARQQPILSVTFEEMDDPTLGPLIKDAIGREAIERAFGPGGDGIAEVERNCAMVSLVQAIRKSTKTSSSSGDGEEDVLTEAACDVTDDHDVPS